MKKIILRALRPFLYFITAFSFALSAALPAPRAFARALSQTEIAAAETAAEPAKAERTTPLSKVSYQTAVPAASYFGSPFACILSDETYFYESETSRAGLFILPKTYFVKVLERGDLFSRVEYLTNDNGAKKLTGFCKTEQLTLVDYVPKTPYLYAEVSITYSIDGVKGSPFLTEITLSCPFYGKYRVGSETYAYVLRGEEFGYVPLPDSFTYPENPEYYENLVQDEPSTPTAKPQQTESSTPVQTAILVLLCVLVPVLAALVLRPSRRPPYEREE